MANHVINVGQWLLDSGERRAIHLQKIAYFGQVWSLVWTGRPLVSTQFEAWPKGPVSRDLYREHRYGRTGGTLHGGDADSLSDTDKSVLAAVLAFYRPMTGDALIHASHDEAWTAARGELPATAFSTDHLDLTIAVREYTKRSILGEGPTPPAGVHRSFDAAAIQAETARQDERWAGLHAKLARV